MNSVLDHTPERLAESFREQGIEPFRARQVTRWVFSRGVRNFEDMTDLSRPLRAELGARWRTRVLERQEAHRSSDGTVKLVLGTDEGARIETVIIPEGRRRTVCLSSQVGCSLTCSFCATGRLGLLRNLRTDEIVDQLLIAREVLAERGEGPTHVVFMGMGEPLLNLSQVIGAVRILAHPDSLGLSPRRITVSTAGVVPRLADLGQAVPVQVRLAVSLHATTDEVRDRLVPLNRRFPIAMLLAACREYPLPPRGRLSIEYTLIRGLNDRAEDGQRLVGLLRGLRAHVNLIELNPSAGSRFLPSPEPVLNRFAGILARARVPVTVRRSRGGDILAACGQLGATASPFAVASSVR
ncbi:MAG: 23S rRNA (adenine(2503)-C(2))-methyltransferase RlmN [Myxococcota bacterium]